MVESAFVTVAKADEGANPSLVSLPLAADTKSWNEGSSAGGGGEGREEGSGNNLR